MRSKRRILLILAVALAVAGAGCGSRPAGTGPGPSGAAGTGAPTPAAQAGALTPATPGWPRQVQDAEGKTVTIPAKPMRIHTLSVGYDEITMWLVGPERFAAVGTATANPLYSNIAQLAQQVPRKVGRKSEDVLAARPDLVVASPFANKDVVAQLKDTGVTVVVSNLQDSIDGHTSNIRFLAHLYGEEERGEALIAQVSARLQRLDTLVSRKPVDQRLRVISLSDRLNTPGSGTTMDGIMRRAGAINAAAAAGINLWQQITLEKVVELRPDVILVAEGSPNQKNQQAGELLVHPSLQNTPAVRGRRVYSLPGRYISTLSHWNVRGAEELARLLWPEDLIHVQFDEFVQPGG